MSFSKGQLYTYFQSISQHKNVSHEALETQKKRDT